MPETEPPPRPEIRTERRGRALWIWIDREERRNAMNKRVLAGIEAAVAAAPSDPAIRAIVLTGAGRKAFCAGADLSGGTGTFILGLDEPMTDFGRLARADARPRRPHRSPASTATASPAAWA